MGGGYAHRGELGLMRFFVSSGPRLYDLGWWNL